MQERRRLRLPAQEPAYLNDFSRKLVKGFYTQPGESINEALERAAIAYCYGDYDFAQRIFDYAHRGWFFFASPVFSNSPKGEWVKSLTRSIKEWNKEYEWVGAKPKGMPISCFLQNVDDTLESQVRAQQELAWLSTAGGGVGSDLNMRAVSEKAPGPIPYAKALEGSILYYHQAGTRRGSIALYMDDSHPAIREFVNIRKPHGGDINRKAMNVNNGVNLTDAFFKARDKDEMWQLKCPHTGEVRGEMRARELWEEMLDTRYKTGEPYMHYIDEANRRLNPAQKALGLKINSANLCSEIELATNEERTAVCCLSSVNLEKADEWLNFADTFIPDLVRLLDNVLQFFIENAHPVHMKRAIFSAYRERSIGLGQMGLHGWLQKNMTPFESEEGVYESAALSKAIYQAAVRGSQKLAKERGEAPDLVGTGMRNAHLCAIAPTSNNSIIIGTTPCTEPEESVSFPQRTRAGTFLVRSKFFAQLLEEAPTDGRPALVHLRGKDQATLDEWREAQYAKVEGNDGDVSVLNWLTPHEERVFKGAKHIDQHWNVRHGRVRARWLDQGQSQNLFFKTGASKAYFNSVHLYAFAPETETERPLKALYYINTESKQKAENVSVQVDRKPLRNYEEQAADAQAAQAENEFICGGCEA
jgi:ribonucleoside-diphosphate reductase alpha chain